tara:strand:- start:1062 stop:1826 length:765 start_codon:yes stop_codon:yes gene_type:complete
MSDPNSQLVQLIRSSSRILIFTGAGISTPSGIPDFRGPQGVWKTRRPVYFQDFLSSEEARIEYWDQKLEGWEAFRDAEPNAIHEAVAQLERSGKVEAVITQNVDGLHGKAGTSSERLVEIHGSNAEIECLDCGRRSQPDLYYKAFAETRKPPQCGCGGLVKTATISFGQNLRPDDIERAMVSAGRADLVIAMGSTLSVYPAAGIPVEAARNGAKYVIINRGDTDHDMQTIVTLRIEADVTDAFPPAVAEALSPT